MKNTTSGKTTSPESKPTPRIVFPFPPVTAGACKSYVFLIDKNTEVNPTKIREWLKNPHGYRILVCAGGRTCVFWLDIPDLRHFDMSK